MQNIREHSSRFQEAPLERLANRGEIEVVPDSELENRIVSPCGRFESFDYNGFHFDVDWDEIDPPGEENEPEIPHEQVMAEMRELLRMWKEER